MDPETTIERALPAFSAARNGEWEDLESALASAGIPAALADDVLTLVPLAFGRALMGGMGIGFSPEYSVADSAGNVRPGGRLADHPLYAAAAARAREIFASTENRDTGVAAAMWSSELSAVNQALHAGSNPADLVTSPPVLMLPEAQEASAPTGTIRAQPEKRPWWRFWG